MDKQPQQNHKDNLDSHCFCLEVIIDRAKEDFEELTEMREMMGLSSDVSQADSTSGQDGKHERPNCN